jgi:hypothetical protein
LKLVLKIDEDHVKKRQGGTLELMIR